MDAAQVADTLGVMALMAIVTAAALGLIAVVRPASRAPIADRFAEHGRVSAWLVAAIATGGSLWFSEAANFPPCELCWYQRIAMYPLVVVLGLRVLRPGGSGDLRTAGLALVVVGLAVNVWHVAIETFPDLDSGACDAAVPCTIRWVEGIGVFTIPRLATVAFGLIAVMILLDRTDRHRGGDGSEPYDPATSTPREGSTK